VDVEGSSVLSDGWDQHRFAHGDRQFIAKGEMAMGCRGVDGEEVGAKCGCMQGCCDCARPGVRSWRRMVQLAVSTKNNKFGAAARQS